MNRNGGSPANCAPNHPPGHKYAPPISMMNGAHDGQPSVVAAAGLHDCSAEDWCSAAVQFAAVWFVAERSEVACWVKS